MKQLNRIKPKLLGKLLAGTRMEGRQFLGVVRRPFAAKIYFGNIDAIPIMRG